MTLIVLNLYEKVELIEDFFNQDIYTFPCSYYFGDGLYQVEVDYLCNEEWAQNCDDILWRRTKLGLTFSAENKAILADYLQKLVN